MESMDKLKKTEEGTDLVGSPTFTFLENGRLRCVETGHEVLARDKESYSRSKRCRLGLIDHALTQGNPLLDMFTQCPLSRSKLVCKLTGDTVNKSTEHIWKHVNGKRFLNKLEQMEKETEFSGRTGKTSRIKPRGDAKMGEMKKKGKDVVIMVSRIRDKSETDSEDPDFWMPPCGGNRSIYNSSESEQESDEGIKTADDDVRDFEEISERTKRMSIECGLSSFAPRKKKSRTDMT